MSAPKFYWEVSPSKYGRGFVGMVYHEDRAGKTLLAFIRDDSRDEVAAACEMQMQVYAQQRGPIYA
jgi:hypothetical protein